MATPIILKTGSVSGPGTAGEGSNDLEIGETVTLTDTEAANAGEAHFTEFEDVPIGSALTFLTDEATETPDFVPDVTGSYRVKMTVNGVDSSVEIFAVPLARTGARIPSFQEMSEYDAGGNVKGWHLAITTLLRTLDADYQVIGAHKNTHIRGAGDEVDGDKIDIDWAPTYYTRDSSPGEVSSDEHLTAHFKGIDNRFAKVPGDSAQKLVAPLRIGDVATHDSATPLVVSQFVFDPSEYTLARATRSLVLAAVAANGGGVAQTKVRIYSITDGEYIGAGLTFTTASPAKQQETLTIGSGAGEVDDSEKIYECRIWVVAPDGLDDTIELGSAELRLVNTID